jgi:small GTP-binding protein
MIEKENRLMEEEVKTRIKNVRESKNTQLDLSNCSLKEIPGEVFELTHLVVLKLGNYSTVNVNQIKEIPPKISRLKKLQILELRRNLLSDLPKEISRLKNLQKLDLIENNLSKLTEGISKLQNLEELYLIQNQLSELPPGVFQLKSLEGLYLGNNKLEELPVEIGYLKNLRELYLNDNLLKEIPLEIGQLENLQELNLNNNRLKKVPPEISQLKNIRKLNLGANQLIELPREIFRLKNLQNLDLSGNKFLKAPPPEIVKQSIGAVKNYFEELEKGGTEYWSEANLVLVGDSGVGKTTLAKALSLPKFELETESKTEGIKITPWFLSKNELDKKRDFRLNIWNFGGKEIYRAVHQIFMPKHSLYLLVTEPGKENNSEYLYYWLNTIKTSGDKSPIIIVMNKCDLPGEDVPIKKYSRKFANIVGFKKVSSKPGYKKTIESLRTEIKRIITDEKLLPNIGISLPTAWMKIRKKLDALSESGKNYIDYNHYLKICREHGVNEAGSQYLIEFLNDLGVVLFFKDYPELKEIVFLSLEWVAEGIYGVLNSELVKKKKGRFNDTDLIHIWKDEKHKDKQKELLALMKSSAFELCLEVEKGEYLIPMLLPGDESREQLEDSLIKYQAAINEDPENIENWEKLHRTLMELARENEALEVLERIKTLKDKKEFKFNLTQRINLQYVELNGLNFFQDFRWVFQPQVNILLGRNGYGKSHLLRLILSLLQEETKISAEFFYNCKANAYTKIIVKRSEERKAIHRIERGFETSIGRIPLLALPDIRYINKASNTIGRAHDIEGELKEVGAHHFLYQRPYEPIIQNFYHNLGAIYFKESNKNESPQEVFERLLMIRFLEKIVKALTDNKFAFHRVEYLEGKVEYRLEVITEGNEKNPLPLQKASQGTLSILSIFGLIYSYLKSVFPDTPEHELLKKPAIVFIDEIDAHLHPAWQQKIVHLLRQNFPNVQFIVTAYSPLVIAGCKEREVSVLKKEKKGFKLKQLEQDFIGYESKELYQVVFEVEERDENYLYYNALYPFRPELKAKISELERKKKEKDFTGEDKEELNTLYEDLYYSEIAYEKSKKRNLLMHLLMENSKLKVENKRLRKNLKKFPKDE